VQGRRVGQGAEWVDQRDYRPGDDLRRIDWAAAARTDRLVVRLTRAEVSPQLDLLVDASSSCAVPSSKGQALLQLAGLLHGAAQGVGFRVRAATVGRGPARFMDGHPPETLGSLLAAAPMGEQEPPLHLPALGRMAFRVLLTDSLLAQDPLPLMRLLGHEASRAVCVVVFAAEELSPQLPACAKLLAADGSSRGVEWSASTRATYLANMARHRAAWSAAARAAGVELVSVVAEEQLAKPLHALLAQGVLA
jgi:uncharacterized protein (DUF58 family)